MRQSNDEIMVRFFLSSLAALSFMFGDPALAEWGDSATRAPSQENSDDLKSFLKSCGYGALIGAGLGAVSLVVVDDAGRKTMNIAKGASLGLYAGIGFGIYNIYFRPQEKSYLSSVDGGTLPAEVKHSSRFTFIPVPGFNPQDLTSMGFVLNTKFN